MASVHPVLKDFNEILTDYDFFASHSTEAEMGSKAVAKILSDAAQGVESLDLLDFGGGDAGFLSKVLSQPGVDASRVVAVVFDPSLESLKIVGGNLAATNLKALKITDDLKTTEEQKFDLILVNHVLYYVNNLQPIVLQLFDRLKPNGKIIIVMATEKNHLTQFWEESFDQLQMKIPYHLFADVVSVLSSMGLPTREIIIPSETKFEDTLANRTHMARFLTGSYFASFERDHLLSLFDRHSSSGHVILNTEDKMLVIEKPK